MLEERDAKTLERYCAPTVHYEAGAIGELGASWYAFIRGVLRASDVIDKRRAARSAVPAQSDTQREAA